MSVRYASGSKIKFPEHIRLEMQKFLRRYPLLTGEQLSSMFFPDRYGIRPSRGYFKYLAERETPGQNIGEDALKNIVHILKTYDYTTGTVLGQDPPPELKLNGHGIAPARVGVWHMALSDAQPRTPVCRTKRDFEDVTDDKSQVTCKTCLRRLGRTAPATPPPSSPSSPVAQEALRTAPANVRDLTPTQKSTLQDELDALQMVLEVLSELDKEACGRVLEYAGQRFEL